MTTEIKIRKSVDNVTSKHKYDIIDDYIYSGLSTGKIAEKYKTTTNNVELIISRHYKALQNVRETKVLLASQAPTFCANFKSDVLDSEKINKEFLELLSEPDSLVLSDNEVVFAELFNYDGDSLKALAESKLDIGLKKGTSKEQEAYIQAAQLRAFYLRRKPNVAEYIRKIQEDKLKTIIDGKGFIQSQLLSVIEKLQNLSGERSAMTHLKAISELARTYGAFEDKLTVEGLDGDSAIDRILKKAQEAKGEVIEADE